MFCSKCGKDLPDDSTFCSKCGNALSASVTAPAPAPQAKKKSNVGVWMLLAILVLVGGLWVANQNRINNQSGASSTSTVPRIFPTDRTQPLVNTAITVKATTYSYYKFTVPPGATNVFVDGHFSAAGGAGNDIETFVCDEDSYVNFQNNHPSKAYFISGKVTQSNINARLPDGGGNYYLVLNNKFSLFAPKAVQLNATLHYTN
jgi:predicted nucleic acid-binding Zn ribbon protein